MAAGQHADSECTGRHDVGQAQPISYFNAAVSSRLLGNQCHNRGAGDEPGLAGLRCRTHAQTQRKPAAGMPTAEAGAQLEAHRRDVSKSIRTAIDPLLDAAARTVYTRAESDAGDC